MPTTDAFSSSNYGISLTTKGHAHGDRRGQFDEETRYSLFAEFVIGAACDLPGQPTKVGGG